ncbi:unnamed protein product [Rhizoctonia solani]|uniref:Uncharacterized protein n=1 Tax=Rhizoctonia solani TaxID=456999 RepID=A0A8H3HCR6_9AGAM|nr:unnamed protein product [Rhizoctonia solani]
MLRVVTRSAFTGALNYCLNRTLGFKPGREFQLGLAKDIRSAQRSLRWALSTRYSSSTLGSHQTPSASSPSSGDAPSSTSGPTQNSDGHSGEKRNVGPKINLKDNQAKEKEKTNKASKSKKEKKKKKKKEEQERIIAALAEAIEKDDWPNIIRHSTLNPQLLDGWHPDEGESDWLAAHRMSEALGAIPEEEWGDIQENGIISTQKLARVIARKHMGEVTYLPEVEDEEEMELYRNWKDAIGYDFEEVWAAEQERLEKIEQRRIGETPVI